MVERTGADGRIRTGDLLITKSPTSPWSERSCVSCSASACEERQADASTTANAPQAHPRSAVPLRPHSGGPWGKRSRGSEHSLCSHFRTLVSLRGTVGRLDRALVGGSRSPTRSRPKDVDTGAGTLRVLHGTGEGPHRFDPEAFALLERCLDRRAACGLNGRSALFCSVAGGPLKTAHPRFATSPRAPRAPSSAAAGIGGVEIPTLSSGRRVARDPVRTLLATRALHGDSHERCNLQDRASR